MSKTAVHYWQKKVKSMARPVKPRRICAGPKRAQFAPKNPCGWVQLALEELETLRLIDQLGMTQADCARQMQVARTTVQLIYDNARRKVATALAEGKGLRIEGGRYVVCGQGEHCCGQNCRRTGCGRQAACCCCGQNQTQKGAQNYEDCSDL